MPALQHLEHKRKGILDGKVALVTGAGQGVEQEQLATEILAVEQQQVV